MNDERCISCGCVVDKEYHGHHSVADCRIMKFAESYAKDAKIEVLESVVKVIDCVYPKQEILSMIAELKAGQ